MRFGLIVGVVCLIVMSTASLNAKSRYGVRRAPREKPVTTRIYSGLESGTLLVKFVDDLGVYVQADRLYYPDGQPVTLINNLVDRGIVLSVQPEFEFNKATLMKWRATGESRLQAPLADLSTYIQLNLAKTQTVADAGRLADLLNHSDEVELSYLRGVAELAGDISPATPDFEPSVAYLGPAPGGVDAYASWGYPGGKGETVTILDIELGWQTDHEDLTKLAGNIIGGDAGVSNHGTAVMGEMVADSSLSGITGIGYGVTGISYGASAKMITVSLRTTENALLLAGENLTVGDIILIELHQPGPNSTGNGQFGYVPMEWTPAIFDVIQTLTANGIIVCEAAGNGSQDLDDAVYGGWFDATVQHSGAIICGAGAPPSGAFGLDRSRLGFSNHGQRVDLQGYGNGVVTTGYGGLFDPDDPRQLYTATFGGTSAASPIVTASVACVQGRYKAVSGGYTMTAKEIRDLLYSTGSPQTGTTSEHIGPRPDLGAAIPLIMPLSAYSTPRTFNVSLLDPPVVIDTLWLVNPHGSVTTYDITVIDSLPVIPSPQAAATPTVEDKVSWRITSGSDAFAAAFYTTGWLSVIPTAGSIPAGDSVPVLVSFDGFLLSGSYFGSHYRGRLDVEVNGAAGIDTLPVPVLALAQDSLHGDTITVRTATINFSSTSETNLKGWNYNDLSASGWLWDGSFLVARRALGDTTVYRDVFGNARNWRGLDFWKADSSWMPDYLIWRDSSMTEDSLMGLRYEVWVPMSGDSADFALWRTQLYSRSLTNYSNVLFGVVADWDVQGSTGANNFGAFDSTRNMIYQTGNTGFESNAAGFALIGQPAFSAVVGSNPADVYPYGGFVDSRLYEQMNQTGYRVDASNTDLHIILTAFKETVTQTDVPTIETVMLSSQTGVPGLEAAYARAVQLSDSLRYLQCPIVITGDVNVDGVLTAGDIIYLVNYVFKGGVGPQPIEGAGDVDCTGVVTSSDIIYEVNHVFKSGPVPCDACTLF